MLVNGTNVSAYESISVEGAPAAVAGAVYEQANIYEEASQDVVTEYSATSKNAVVTESEHETKTIAVEGSSNDTKTIAVGVETVYAAQEAESTTEETEGEAAAESTAVENIAAESAAAAEQEQAADVSADSQAADEQAAVSTSSVTYEVPSYSGNKSYESYRVIRRGKAGTLQTMAQTNADGFRMVQGRYLVAVGYSFGASRGQYIDLTLENGTVIPCIVGDMKAAPIFSANGCCSEFIVDTAVIKNVVNTGDVSDYRSDWDSPVDTITVHNTFAL